MITVPGGKFSSYQLRELASHVKGVAVTPWKSFFINSAKTKPPLSFLSKNTGHDLSVSYCSGKAYCSQGILESQGRQFILLFALWRARAANYSLYPLLLEKPGPPSHCTLCILESRGRQSFIVARCSRADAESRGRQFIVVFAFRKAGAANSS